MVKAIPEARRQELRELVFVAHADPKEYLESLKAVKKSQKESWADVADLMGNPQAAQDIRRNELAKKLMEQDNG
jgi:Ulp1 family protease